MKSLTNYICEAMQKKFNGFAILKPEFLDIKDDFTNKDHEEAEKINDDIVFEIELLKQVEINIDYAAIPDEVPETEDDSKTCSEGEKIQWTKCPVLKSSSDEGDFLIDATQFGS